MEKGRSGMTLDDAKKAAEAVAAKRQADVFLYNGTITRNNVLSTMEILQKDRSCKRLFLLMVTYGGDPHAAFKISRYIQESYDHFTLFVPGFCKSAGTLFAIAANEVVFAPFGELGPLDVQMAKPDQFQFDSGLVIGESLETLERRAAETFKAMFSEVIAEQQGLISVNSAMHAASELTKAIYAPIMARIDPEEVGVRQRALRIALDYGGRLALKSQNVKQNAVRMLAEKYSSHSFVIDKHEAMGLFKVVSGATDEEMALAQVLGTISRIEQSGNVPPTFTVLCKAPKLAPESRDKTNEKDQRSGVPASARGTSRGTNGPPVATSPNAPRGRGRGVRSRNSSNGRAHSEAS